MYRSLGRYGIAAGVLACSSIGLGVWAVQLDAQGVLLRQRAQTQATTVAAVPVESPVKPATIGQHIDSFVETFPPLSQSPTDLETVFSSARGRDIKLLKGDYQFKNDVNSALVVLTATFPVNAAYTTTREFVADVLRAIPNASMDELRMARSAANVAELDSSIRFSFVYRRP
jgi:hypothetical protein